MTQVIFYKSNGTFYGFEENGHTGYAETGSDILCSAISAMTMLVINTAENAYSAKAACQIDKEGTHIKYIASEIIKSDVDVKKKYAIAGLIKAYYDQLKMLEEDYSNFLKVSATEKHI